MDTTCTVTGIAIIVIGALEAVALVMHEDGTTLLPVVGAISAVAGYKLAPLVQAAKEKLVA